MRSWTTAWSLWTRVSWAWYTERSASSTLMKLVRPLAYCSREISSALAAGGHRRPQRDVARLLLGVGHQGVLHVLEPGEHGLLVGRQRLLLAGVLHPDVGAHPARVEEVPLEGGTQRPGAAAGREQVAGLALW